MLQILNLLSQFFLFLLFTFHVFWWLLLGMSFQQKTSYHLVYYNIVMIIIIPLTLTKFNYAYKIYDYKQFYSTRKTWIFQISHFLCLPLQDTPSYLLYETSCKKNQVYACNKGYAGCFRKSLSHFKAVSSHHDNQQCLCRPTYIIP